ncbi:reverse transcriptase domain-containing protein [Tanacetum coccineum]
MTTPVEKRNHAKFCEFHGEVGHNTDECMHLRKQIEEMLKAGKLSHMIKELKQKNGKEQPKVTKKGETSGKDKALAILMLLVNIGDKEHPASAWMNFVVVRSPSPYNGIIGRLGVRKLQAVLSTANRMLKIPVEKGVITLHSSKLVLLECAMVFGPEGTPSTTKPIIEERVEVAINPEYLKQTKPVDMIDIPRHSMEHRLNVREGCSPVRQKKRGQAADRNQAIQEEVRKIVEAGIIKEVQYHDWLSNLVMVKKHDDSWRMCIDFKDLNKSCPKDGYTLSKIDWKVESLNARATYQRLVDKAFHKQIGKNLEVYVDDLVIKIRIEDEKVKDIEETFKTLREINMKLNPKKYIFGVEEGMFLGYKVNTKGLKMKQLIAELPMLTAPMEKEELIVYLAAAKETVSAVLMTEREAKQIPIYFISRALRGPKLNYTPMENKRSAFWSLNEDILKINVSKDQYAVSIKEDTAYPCLHSPKTTKGMKLDTPYPEDSIRRIQDMYQYNILEDIKRGPYSKKSPIRRI